MSAANQLIDQVVARIAEATGDDPYAIRKLLVDDPDAFEEKYRGHLTEDEARFFGMAP